MLTLYNFDERGGIFLIQTLLDLNLHTSVNTYSISWPLLAAFPPSYTCGFHCNSVFAILTVFALHIFNILLDSHDLVDSHLW